MSKLPVIGACLALLTLLANPAVAQQTGTVTGTVTNAETAQPLSGVQVTIEGTRLGTITGQNGRYLIPNVPAGSYSIVAQMIGFGTDRRDNVRVPAEGSVTANFQLRTQALSIQEVVVTGVVDPVSGVRAPFTVGKVSAEQMPVPQTVTSPVAALQGRVAGVHVVRGTGQPGSGVDIQLRTPTSIVRSNAPLIVVDGVILGANSVDIESLDIESIEVVKGAAAASLYGSRAASGVIQIRTRRGRDVAIDRTRIVARSEYGINQMNTEIPLARHHFWRVNEQGQFVNAAGQPTTVRTERVSQPVRFMDQPWGVQTYDHLAAFFDPGRFNTNSLTVANNTAATNWSAQLVNTHEAGVLRTNEGLNRNSLRVNLDHRLRNDFTVGISGYHMRSHRDDLSGTPFWELLLMPPDVNLLQRDTVTGQLMHQPDPTLQLENPIWRQTSRNNFSERMRTLGSVNARFNPIPWLTFEGDLSYDRSDRYFQQHVPRGTPTVSVTAPTLGGTLYMEEAITDALNASLGSTALFNFGALTTRTTLRGLIEREENNWFWAQGEDFLFDNVPRLGATERQTINSQLQEIRANGYFAHTGLDYAGKYIGDLLIRRDGSSLFGPEGRWNTYYRASAAYRMAQEPWWPIPALNEFKLNYSIGTAGGRPNFGDRFETVTVDATTRAVTRDNLGNNRLRPELSREQEMGLTAILHNRYSLQLTYAHTETTGQIVQIPQAAVLGFFSQWANSGAMEGRTFEATLEAQLLNTRNAGWSANLVADRSRHEITEWNRPCYVSGITYRCGGETLGIYYGQRLVTNQDELPARFHDFRDQFQVNDDGYLVWVGAGNSWQEGISKNLWGTTATRGGRTLQWGHPVVMEDEDGQIATVRIGDSNPTFKWGLGNNIRLGGMNIYALLDSSIGHQIYNTTKQRLYQHERHGDLDQAGKPAEAKKPFEYYHAGLYRGNNVNSHFVEDASYVALREVSLRYGLRENQLRAIGVERLGLGMDRVSIGLIGRNLFTWTNYTGFDPQVGNTTLQQDNIASTTVAYYPNYRTLTAFVEVQF